MTRIGLKGGQLTLLTRRDIDKIHNSTIDILENTGVKCDSKKICSVFKDFGADVNSKTSIIKLPASLVKEALDKCPKKIILRGRKNSKDILLEDQRVYFVLGGTPPPFIIDYKTEESRRPTKKDVSEATRLGDSLDNISVIMSLAGAYDVPPEVEYLHEFEAIISNTTKPIIHSAPGITNAKKILEMASVVAGGYEELKKRPIVNLYSEATSPLLVSSLNENIIEFAKMKAPIILGPSPMAGATAPATIVGSVLIGNAEFLATLTLSQLVSKGAPVIFGSHPGVMDMRTGRFQYGSIDLAIGWTVIAQLADYYSIPSFGQGGCCDSKVPDAQAASEASLSAVINALAGINLIHNVGTCAMGDAGSIELALICDEIIGMIFHILEGVDISDEHLALDIIRNVGPGGHFLSQKHTRDFYKDQFYISKFFDKRSLTSWEASGKKDIRSIVKEKLRNILENYTPEPISSEDKKGLMKIIREIERTRARL